MDTNTIEYRKGNVVDAFINGEGDFLIHGCNCRGIMGSGVAKEIKRRIPEAFSAYHHVCHNSNLQGSELLGTNVVVPFGFTTRCVVNMFTQNFYGTDERHFNYGAFAKCLNVQFSMKFDQKIVMPKVGAGLGGGDWQIIEEIIRYSGFSKNHFIVYELE
jgi:O-acetyl-ADP-ribose deacetylase (regulator of RNase III)